MHGLNDRLRGFARRSITFALPNKKAAYELTHIVFYLSEYGRRDPEVGQAFIDSLHFAGTLAFLELNLDLLAEICIALRFAGAAARNVGAMAARSVGDVPAGSRARRRRARRMIIIPGWLRTGR